jgi:Tfp pilus assembly protein PilF
MANTAQHLDAQQRQPDLAMLPTERTLDPETILDMVSALVAQGQLALATEMTDLARIIHPNNEPVLATSALVAEVSQDWFKARALLTRLRHLQGTSITAETYRHEIRVLRCLGSVIPAMNLAQVTLEKFPSDTILLQEYEELLSLFNTELGALG